MVALKSDSVLYNRRESKQIKKRNGVKIGVITVLEWFHYTIRFAYKGHKLRNKTKFSVRKCQKSKVKMPRGS